jgi:hypothetical protein
LNRLFCTQDIPICTLPPSQKRSDLLTKVTSTTVTHRRSDIHYLSQGLNPGTQFLICQRLVNRRGIFTTASINQNAFTGFRTRVVRSAAVTTLTTWFYTLNSHPHLPQVYLDLQRIIVSSKIVLENTSW